MRQSIEKILVIRSEFMLTGDSEPEGLFFIPEPEKTCRNRQPWRHPLNILTFNCGSSSLTFKVFQIKDFSEVDVLASGKAHRVGVKGSEPPFIEYHAGETNQRSEVEFNNHSQASSLILTRLRALGIKFDYIGHRWGHSAGRFTSAMIDDRLLKKLESLVHLMPIHHPAMISVIKQCSKNEPDLPNYVTADGAFHATIPSCAYTYALPQQIIQKHGFRRYGFHGLSYQYVIGEASRFLKKPVENLKIVACHLGTGGSSVAAVKGGISVDTTMGYSALPGLMMSTRSGDIDPMLTLYFMASYDYQAEELMDIFNKKSGLLGISGFSSDIRDIIQRFSDDDGQSRLAFKMYTHRIKKYIGSYVAVLGNMDALIFTDDIGLRNPLVREEVCEGLRWCGIQLCERTNTEAVGDGISKISSDASKVDVLTIPTEEELVICMEGLKLIRSGK